MDPPNRMCNGERDPRDILVSSSSRREYHPDIAIYGRFCDPLRHSFAVPCVKSSVLNLQPVTFKEACSFIDEHHSTHDPPQGWKYGTAVNDGNDVVGVITVGRPVSRHQDNGQTLEVTRCCTDGTKNAASKLYAAAWRAARAIGYDRLITYTLVSEEATPLRAVKGYEVVHQTEGGSWDKPSRPRVDTSPDEQKTLWEVTK